MADLNPAAIATKWLEGLNNATDAKAFTDQFLPTGWLRDLMCFSWDLRSISGRDSIADFLSAPCKSGSNLSRFERAGLHDCTLETTRIPPSTFPVPGVPGLQGVIAVFSFALKSPAASGRGVVRLLPDGGGGWKAFTVLLNMEELKGHEEPSAGPKGYFGTTWEEEQEKRIAEIERDPTVLIVGGGQAGLMCAARLGRMGIRALVVEKTPRVGDVWRKRYPNLSLHISAYSCSVLYQSWPKTYPRFLPKGKIADFLEAYAVGQEIHVWASSTVLPTPSYDTSTGRWTVEIDRAGTRVSITPKHIVFATGIGSPRVPKWPGMDSFEGAIYHSDVHKGSAPFKDKRAVIVGACNAGIDICEEFVVKGAAEVTMVQRSATCVASQHTVETLIQHLSPESELIPIEDGDLMANSMPMGLILKLIADGGAQQFKEADKELFEGLTKAGFKLTWEPIPGEGETGYPGFLLHRATSGAMLDMGNAQMIVDGRIKVKQGVEIERIDRDGLVFADGSKILADVIVLATGYEPIIKDIASIMGKGIKDLVGDKFWGLDEAGELSNCFKPTGAPGIWFAPGPFSWVRFLSKHLAINILAEELGLKGRNEV
ncbi:FAD/NAD(P)-binding domain-containing protein [Roridomyces roridus]|uniref:FAD/NAD(P)-binding domain-containing protein n=1 Tax=Roridomyces roridus TaxID=1738132 RepID=A0AAD7FG34_9AGAR|nr:FAD/NAD(P)-binding domain-containing protein [Roridomyces roridus]